MHRSVQKLEARFSRQAEKTPPRFSQMRDWAQIRLLQPRSMNMMVKERQGCDWKVTTQNILKMIPENQTQFGPEFKLGFKSGSSRGAHVLLEIRVSVRPVFSWMGPTWSMVSYLSQLHYVHGWGPYRFLMDFCEPHSMESVMCLWKDRYGWVVIPSTF